MLTTFLASLFSFIFLNVPIAFSLILTTIVLMVFSNELSSANIASSIYRGVDNFPLMAIPFFMLAGEIMNMGGMSKRIVNFANVLVGHVTGGLGYVSVLASMIDLDDAVARSDPALLGRRPLRDDRDIDRVALEDWHLGALGQDHRHQHERQDDVHHRPGNQDAKAVPLGPGDELIGGPGVRFVRVLARHLHVAADGQQRDRVFGLAALELEELRPHPDAERDDPDAQHPRHDEVAQFVDENQDTKDEHEGQKRVEQGIPSD